MNKVAQFKKVSLEQFEKDMYKTFGEYVLTKVYLQDLYNNITIPKRATKGSAGHDFRVPFDYCLKTGCSLKIPTGIRCKMDEEQVMFIFPRSSLGIKNNMIITNTVPVVDSDYYHAENEGHIFICVKNCGEKDIEFKKGDAFCQAVFLKFGVADDVEISAERTGGIGSTGK